MRVQESIVRTGYFWLPDYPDRKLPGTLTIRDGGESELEVLDNFDTDLRSRDQTWSIPRLVGQIEKEGLVTLEDCHYRKKTVPMGTVSKSLLRSDTVVVGTALDADDPLEFRAFLFSVEGLEEWVGISGTKITFSDDTRCMDLAYTPPEERRFRLTDDLAGSIVFAASISSSSYGDGAGVSERTHLRLESPHKLPLNTFTSIAAKITNLLCFAMNATVCMREAKAFSEIEPQFDPDGSIRQTAFSIFYPSLPHTDVPSTLHRFSYFFSFSEVESHFEDCLTNWMDAYEEIRPSVNLYFSAKNGGHRYAEPRFLALAQAIETLHRRLHTGTLMPEKEFKALLDKLLKACPESRKAWLNTRLLFGNELPLRKRLSAIAKPYADLFGGPKGVSKMVKKTTDTRNYLTHYDPRLEAGAAHNADLVKLATQLEALLELHLLQRLGFSAENIRQIAGSSYRFSQKLKWSKSP